MRFLIGTSGWQYDDWRGTFYPDDLPQKQWLEFYAARFPTVEVNNTFYRLPDREVFAQWGQRVSDGFCFSLKMSRYLSHIKRLKAPAEPLHRFASRAEAMDGTWGVTLLQLPPTMHVDVGRLAHVLDLWSAERRLAVELRHDSWFTDEVRDLLTQHEVALVLADRYGHRLQPMWRTAPWTYVRFHQGTHNHPSYRTPTLGRWFDELREQWRDDEDAYVYFNNDQTGAAVRDAAHFADLVGAELPTPAPDRS
jgi:uncharacterized protein YecE (DUF72 family)